MAENKGAIDVLTGEQITTLLSKEEEKLSGELKKLRDFHKAAWDMYGSELCTGEMFDNENKVAKKILMIREMKGVVSSRKLNGEMLKVILADLDGLIARVAELQASLDKDKEALNEEKTLFINMLEIISK